MKDTCKRALRKLKHFDAHGGLCQSAEYECTRTHVKMVPQDNFPYALSYMFFIQRLLNFLVVMYMISVLRHLPFPHADKKKGTQNSISMVQLLNGFLNSNISPEHLMKKDTGLKERIKTLIQKKICINKEERVRHLPGYCPQTSQETKDAEER